MNDLLEANPTYWLEIRQTQRNYLFYTLLFGGILAGAYLFLIVFDPNGNLGWDEFPLMAFPLAVYGVGAFSIPLYVGTKLASQLVNEDLSLQTPLRSRTILWGKLQVAMTLSLCLFVPSLPGAVVLAFMNEPNWLQLVTAAPIVVIGVTMIDLGFMAGAKTPLMRGGMACLSLVFWLGNAPVLLSLGTGFVGMFIYGPDVWEIMMALSFGIMLLLISAIFIFSLGLAVLQRNRNLVHIQFAIGVMMVIFIPFPLLLILMVIGPNIFSIFGFFLLLAAYFAPPILALRSVRRYYDKRCVLPK